MTIEPATDIERFNLFTQDWCIEMRTQNGGPWVKYEDHIARIRIERENAIKECMYVADRNIADNIDRNRTVTAMSRLLKAPSNQEGGQ